MVTIKVISQTRNLRVEDRHLDISKKDWIGWESYSGKERIGRSHELAFGNQWGR